MVPSNDSSEWSSPNVYERQRIRDNWLLESTERCGDKAPPPHLEVWMLLELNGGDNDRRAERNR